LGVSETRRLDDGGIVSVHAIAKQRSGPYFDEQVRRAEFEMSGNGSTMQQQVDERRPGRVRPFDAKLVEFGSAGTLGAALTLFYP
jgi:hypothetical protein